MSALRFQRNIESLLLKTASTFPVTVVTGPRQSGKTTLLKTLFPDRLYVNLEEPDTLLIVSSDIRSFLNQNKKMIIDEAQRLPELFSYLQAKIDENPQPGQYILSGSQNFLLSEKISQTLAGRVAILELLPLSRNEYLSHPNHQDLKLWEFLFNGSYPRPYQENLDKNIWFNSYIQTYLERDVRNLKQIHDLKRFQNFLHLCAGRHGQLLNLSAFGNEIGISQTTAAEWLNILEASYIVFRLSPYYKNFNKRIVKTPKLYFYDTGIVCRLLGIQSAQQLSLHASRGAIFEGYIISEFVKSYTAQGMKSPLYFWRDHLGVEIDLVVDSVEGLRAIEIKSSATFHGDFLKNILAWQKFTKNIGRCSLIYAGDKPFHYHDIEILPWDTEW